MAAREAFAAAPYDEVSVASVAGAAGASEALVYRYFTAKAGLYTAVVQDQLEGLGERQQAAVDGLPAHSSARDQMRVSVEAVLDHVSDARAAWASPFFAGAYEPAPVRDLRLRYRREFVARLTGRLRDPSHRRARIAITGFLGFVGAAAQDWAERGCPEDDRDSLVEAALGALMGALGDWGSFTDA